MEKSLACTCHPSNWQEASNRKIVVQAVLSKKQDPIAKITRAKTVASMAQAVQHVPSKRKALSC
jgi:hypothetical protein